MTCLIYVITDLIHIITIFLLCRLFFKFNLKGKYNNKIIWMIIMDLMVILSVMIYFYNNLILETIVYTITICVVLCIIYDEKRLGVTVSALWIMIIMAMLDTMSLILFEILSKLVKYSSNDLFRLCASLIPLVFVLGLGKIYNKRYSKGIRTVGIWNLLAFTAITFIDTVIVMALALITRIEERITNQLVFFVTFILVILGLFLQLGAVILIMVQRNVYKESQQLTEKYLEEQKNHYEYLEKRETETKKFRHDLRSHMEMLTVLAKKRQYDKFEKYVEEINVNIDRFGNNVTVQNGIVDAIINKYYSEAVANEIDMEVKGRFPSDCKIDAYHLCTIFSNILSNALEATIEAEKKWISVVCKYTEDNILVEVKNTFDNKNTARNGKLRTHKKDANNHGFGLENVKESISKYDGLWGVDIQDNIYTITISFNYVRQEGFYENSDN